MVSTPFIDESPSAVEPAVVRLLELVSVVDPGDEAFAEAESLATRVQDPEVLVGSAAKHRMVPALAEFLRRPGTISAYPMWFQHQLNNTFEWNRYRVNLLIEEAQTIATRLRQRGLAAVFNKGIVCQSSLYDSRGARFFSDIDLMIHPDQREAVSEALRELGFDGAKEYDARTERLVDISREERLLFQLYPDHLPHFHRLTPGTGVPYTRVDVAFSLTWYASAWQVPMDEVLAETISVPANGSGGAELPALNPVYGFLFLVLHLFRECWFQRTAEEGGLRLTQLADIAKFWRRFGRPNAASLRTAITEHELEPVIAWVCHHLDTVFDTGVVGELDLGEYCAPAWLSSMGATDGGYLSWDGDMRTRLYSKEPLRLVPAEEPPYATLARV